MFSAHLESTCLRLRAGERRMLRAPAHGRWIATRGRARLTETPHWLGEQLLSRVVTLHEGEPHVADEAGWVTLHALSDCTLICEMPMTLAGHLVAAWRIIRPGRALRAAA